MDNIIRIGNSLKGKINKNQRQEIINSLNYNKYDTAVEQLLVISTKENIELPMEVIDYKDEHFAQSMRKFLSATI